MSRLRATAMAMMAIGTAIDRMVRERHLLGRRNLDRRLRMKERVGLLLEWFSDGMAVAIALLGHRISPVGS
jgi:hypothetical protein